jgi:hypothetical protein
VQHVHEVGGAELGRSTRGGHLLRQSDQFQRFASCDSHNRPS